MCPTYREYAVLIPKMVKTFPYKDKQRHVTGENVSHLTKVPLPKSITRE